MRIARDLERQVDAAIKSMFQSTRAYSTRRSVPEPGNRFSSFNPLVRIARDDEDCQKIALDHRFNPLVRIARDPLLARYHRPVASFNPLVRIARDSGLFA